MRFNELTIELVEKMKAGKTLAWVEDHHEKHEKGRERHHGDLFLASERIAERHSKRRYHVLDDQD